MSRTKNVLKIMQANISLQIITAICGLILPGLMINEYGSEINGLVSTVRQLLTYFSIISLGLGAASSVALYKPLAENDTNKISRILSATRIFFNRTGYVFTVLVAITSFILPLASQQNNISFMTIMSIVLICGIGSLSEYIIISKYKILLTADQKLYVLAKIQGQGVVINTVLSVILIKLHASIIIVQFISTFAYLLRLLLTIRYVKTNYPEIDFKAKPDFDAISNRWEAFSYQISNMIITYTPILMVAFFCGYNDASIYSVYNMVFAAVAMLVGVFSSGFASIFGNLLVGNDSKKLRNSFNTFEFVFNIILFFAYTTALILILPFISVYIKNRDNINYLIPSIAILFSLNGVFRDIRIPSVTLVEAAGRFKENKNANLLEAILNVVIGLILVFNFGLIGVLISATVTSFIRSIMYIYDTSKHQLKGLYFKRIFTLVANGAIMAVVANVGMGIVYSCNNLIEWIGYALIVSVICLLLFSLLNMLINFGAVKDIYARIINIRKYEVRGAEANE